MNKGLFIINAGSSSVKFAFFSIADKQLDTLLFTGIVDQIAIDPKIIIKDQLSGEKTEKSFENKTKDENYQYALHYLAQYFQDLGYNIQAVGHRVVHGGSYYQKPVRIDHGVIENLKKTFDLAPLHNPYNVLGIEIFVNKMPNAVHVACFDTGFFHTMGPLYSHYAIPESYYEQGLRRYGVHGSSYEYICSILEKIAPNNPNGRYIIAHLGNGSTMSAVQHRQIVATCVGISAIGGLAMGTRADTLESEAVLYLMDQFKLTTTEVRELLYKKSGLLGLSELSSDMRELESQAPQNPKAQFALDVFVNRIVAEFGRLAAILKGVDGFIFTAGIGENSIHIRKQVLQQLQWFGFELDEKANEQRASSIICLTQKTAKVQAWAVPTNEEKVIGEHVLSFL